MQYTAQHIQFRLFVCFNKRKKKHNNLQDLKHQNSPVFYVFISFIVFCYIFAATKTKNAGQSTIDSINNSKEIEIKIFPLFFSFSIYY